MAETPSLERLLEAYSEPVILLNKCLDVVYSNAPLASIAQHAELEEKLNWRTLVDQSKCDEQCLNDIDHQLRSAASNGKSTRTNICSIKLEGEASQRFELYVRRLVWDDTPHYLLLLRAPQGEQMTITQSPSHPPASAERVQHMHSVLRGLTDYSSDQAPVSLLLFNEQWECLFVNKHWQQLTGLDRNESLHLGWLSGIHSQSRSNLINTLDNLVADYKCFDLSLRFIDSRSHTKWLKFSVNAVTGERGEVLRYASAVEITEHITTELKFKKLARLDQLTGLFNRQHINESLERMLIQQSNSGSVSVLYIDLDGFKLINDSLGHLAGDNLLKIAAQRIQAAVPEQAMVGRMGGDEFVVIYAGEKEDIKPMDVADQLLQSLNSYVVFDHHKLKLSCSIGISQSSSEAVTPSEITQQADAALYQAKAAGKNCARQYNSQTEQDTSLQFFIRNEIHSAIDKGELYIEFQPQFNVNNDSIVAFEALTRWNSRSRGLIPTQTLINTLEEQGQIESVSTWIFEQACKEFFACNFSNQTLSINLSPAQFATGSWQKHAQQLINSGVISDPSKITFEITESLLIHDTSANQRILRSLAAQGYRIALDDFGTGYASFSYLRNFPISELKIDRSFTTDICNNWRDLQIIESMVSLAQKLDLRLIAEGVSSKTQMRALHQAGVTIQQGFFNGKPNTIGYWQKQHRKNYRQKELALELNLGNL